MAATQPDSPLDGATTRLDFPILRTQPDGSRVVYLDSAASSQHPVAVLESLRHTYEQSYANVHRGVYRFAVEVDERFEAARSIVASFLNARHTREIVFVRGTTEAVNLVAASWGTSNLGPGDVVVTSELEHHSNFVPWQQVAIRQGATLAAIPIDPNGQLQLDALDKIQRQGQVKVVAIGHVSNSLGTINPVREIADWAHARGAILAVDGAQGAPHRAVDVQELGCDFYAFSGHKLFGPTGAGALWGRVELLEAMPPFQYGGAMIRKVAVEQTTFNELPWKFEAGTPAIAEVIAMGEAIRYLQALGLERVQEHERVLTLQAMEMLSELPGLQLHGPAAGVERSGILSFTLDGVHPHDVAELLDSQGVCVRAGHHCTQPAMRKLGLTATTRASLYAYNDEDDLHALVAGLRHVAKVFGVG